MRVISMTPPGAAGPGASFRAGQPVSDVFFLALLAAVNPTLLAAVTVMLVLPSPKRLLIGYLLGAYVASITLGLVFVFALAGTATESTARTTISPIAYIAVGLLLLVVWAVLRSGRGAGLRERRQAGKAAREAGKGKKEPFTQRLLGRGSARGAFAAGVVLNLPGVSYLTALHILDKQDPGQGRRSSWSSRST